MYLMPTNRPVINRKLGMPPVHLRGFRGIGCACQKKLGSLAQVAGLPAGSVLAYTATWKDTAAQINTPDAVQRSIQTNLAQQFGIVIDSQQHSQSDYFNFSGTQSMTLQLHTTSDYGSAADVQGLIDHAIYSATSAHVAQGMPSSTIRVVNVSAAAGAGTSTVSLTQQYPADVAAQLAAAQAGLQDAIARGDQTSASQYQKLISTIQNAGQTPDPLTWLSNNWLWIAGIGVGVVALRELA